MEIGLPKFYKSTVTFCTITSVSETPRLALKKVIFRCPTHSSCNGYRCVTLNAFYFLLKRRIICLIIDNIVIIKVWSNDCHTINNDDLGRVLCNFRSKPYIFINLIQHIPQMFLKVYLVIKKHSKMFLS